jgi:hypothetical protein
MGDDTDADTETVLVPQQSHSGSSRVYHINPDCQYVTDRMNEWGREMAEAWDFELCSQCDENVDWERIGRENAKNGRVPDVGGEAES